eukprot:CAMPEP_0198506146 /NCGR_PEP_ID=MMETSP1462-20131121/11501_1 /TAXON_ID=1333877 /ORGANISM="Brandtodinium nutriculum, Strain RCC3387" /LENGTH=71 /DNA_ID=CAMNT_0044235355 /DNA_START=43 /DNA_END=255 /DNA_ORIENTATION=+
MTKRTRASLARFLNMVASAKPLQNQPGLRANEHARKQAYMRNCGALLAPRPLTSSGLQRAPARCGAGDGGD